MDMLVGGAPDHRHCPGMWPWQEVLEMLDRGEGGRQAQQEGVGS